MLKSNTFEDIILEGVITNANVEGRTFWAEKFYGKWVISWKEFLPVFVNSINLSFSSIPQNDIKFEFLKIVLSADTSEEWVAIENWGYMLEWFGPMEKGYNLLDRIFWLLTKPYFHGFLSSAKAEKILSNKKKGTFLLRFSATEPGAFTLSVISKDDKLQHFRISHKPGGRYMLAGVEFQSIEQLVTDNKLHKNMKPPLFLNQACTPSPFVDMLNSKEKLAAGYLQPTRKE